MSLRLLRRLLTQLVGLLATFYHCLFALPKCHADSLAAVSVDEEKRTAVARNLTEARQRVPVLLDCSLGAIRRTVKRRRSSSSASPERFH